MRGIKLSDFLRKRTALMNGMLRFVFFIGLILGGCSSGADTPYKKGPEFTDFNMRGGCFSCS